MEDLDLDEFKDFIKSLRLKEGNKTKIQKNKIEHKQLKRLLGDECE